MPLEKSTTPDGKDYVQYFTWDKNGVLIRLRPFYYTRGLSEREMSIVDRQCREDAIKCIGPNAFGQWKANSFEPRKAR